MYWPFADLFIGVYLLLWWSVVQPLAEGESNNSKWPCWCCKSVLNILQVLEAKQCQFCWVAKQVLAQMQD